MTKVMKVVEDLKIQVDNLCQVSPMDATLRRQLLRSKVPAAALLSVHRHLER